MRLKYAHHWLRFKVVNALNPYVFRSPAARTAPNSFKFTRYGFVYFRSGRRLHVSWRFWVEGPCNYQTFKWIHSRGPQRKPAAGAD